MPAETDPTRTAMTEQEAAVEARRIITDFATSYRDQTPVPRYGDAPPVPQPGRPPMSSKAVDDTARMLGASVLIAVSGGSTTAVLWASGYANPTVVALVFGAPTALALALGRVMKRVKEATPDVHHHHYTGHVDQRTVHTKTTGVWARTNNQQ
jgi:acetylornithine deacetylase/succinyl-diaminopimelate desuccinylase-like protein